MDYTTLTKEELLSELQTAKGVLRLHQLDLNRYDKPLILGGVRAYAELAKKMISVTKREIFEIEAHLRHLS